MPRYDFDLFVIGAGSGGVRAARWAAGLAARVAIAEERYLGGTCVNAGCIPKKLLAYAAHYHEDFEDAAHYGWHAGAPHFEWPSLIAAKDREIAVKRGMGPFDDLHTESIEGMSGCGEAVHAWPLFNDAGDQREDVGTSCASLSPANWYSVMTRMPYGVVVSELPAPGVGLI